ncbi:UDP-2,3-diacylglucosamine diphosphatase [Acinetobacter sp. WZC-1]|uniref:UDP-2,3-diacylglucosamine diphosphatase n=1 Tax=Acinetobacter sp. WZC-1 TaxID=3459034 RepID=UPI00403DDB3B
MTYLFISDLHLSPEHPRLIRGFLDLLVQYQHKNTRLYILGDWFDAWIGDDYSAPWLDDIVAALRQFSQSGNQIYFLTGNRDFALGEAFLNQFQGHLLPDVFLLDTAQRRYRLEHGDALCTDDLAYQRFKKIIRHPLLLAILKKTPLSFRQKLAHGFRKKSRQSQQYTSLDIMDINQQAVEQALENVDMLIHGHTHRPAIHEQQAKHRIVLGDWREQTSDAMILEVTESGEWQFIRWPIPD